jgi:hypothetical protein
MSDVPFFQRTVGDIAAVKLDERVFTGLCRTDEGGVKLNTTGKTLLSTCGYIFYRLQFTINKNYVTVK